jgi:hypothetical protein
MFLLFPRNLPHPLAGQLLEVFGALYGLRESNRLFSLEVDRVLRAAGFASDPLSPMLYFKHHPADPGLFVLVSTHVDDFGTKDNCPSLTDSLHAALVARFLMSFISTGTVSSLWSMLGRSLLRSLCLSLITAVGGIWRVYMYGGGDSSS